MIRTMVWCTAAVLLVSVLTGGSCSPQVESVWAIPEGVLEVVVTEDPVPLYDERKVADVARLDVGGGLWRTARMASQGGNHEFWVKARRDGEFIELEYDVVLHGMLHRSVRKRFRDDGEVRRIWISRSYTHADMGRACFPAPRTVEPFAGMVWFATLEANDGARRAGDFQVVKESSGEYRYGHSEAGDVEVKLHDDVRYRTSWTVQEDGGKYSYKTELLQGDELMSVTQEDVFRIDAQTGCQPTASGDYCDTDYI